jgi:hypothetical protein
MEAAKLSKSRLNLDTYCSQLTLWCRAIGVRFKYGRLVDTSKWSGEKIQTELIRLINALATYKLGIPYHYATQKDKIHVIIPFEELRLEQYINMNISLWHAIFICLGENATELCVCHDD